MTADTRTERVRACVLTHTYPRFPGDINAPFVEQLMERVAEGGADISVLTAWDTAWARQPGDHAVDLHTYKYIWPDSLHILGYSRTIEGNVRFRKRVLALSPFLFAGALRAFGSLVRERRPHVLHAHWILPNGWIAGEVSRRTGVPLVIQLHGSDVFTAEKNPLFRAMARRAAARASLIMTPSLDLRDRLVALGIDGDRITWVPNAVESGFADGVAVGDADRLRDRLGIRPGDRVLLAMGRMVHVKGFDHLLEAFRTVAERKPDVTLVLAGGGVLYDDMLRLAGKLGIAGRVVMPGAVMRDEVPVYFRMADVFCVPSVRHESGAVDGLPVVIPEAMAAGLPVVASDVGGIPCLVRHDRTGLLVPEKEPGALADALMTVLGNDGLRERLGSTARDIIRNRVNYDAVADHVRWLYGQVIASRGAPLRVPNYIVRSGT